MVKSPSEPCCVTGRSLAHVFGAILYSLALSPRSGICLLENLALSGGIRYPGIPTRSTRCLLAVQVCILNEDTFSTIIKALYIDRPHDIVADFLECQREIGKGVAGLLCATKGYDDPVRGILRRHIPFSLPLSYVDFLSRLCRDL